MAITSGQPYYRVAFLDKTQARKEVDEPGYAVKRVPWNLVRYKQHSDAASVEPVDTKRDWFTSFRGGNVTEVTDVQFIEEISFFNGSNSIGGPVGDKNF